MGKKNKRKKKKKYKVPNPIQKLAIHDSNVANVRKNKKKVIHRDMKYGDSYED